MKPTRQDMLTWQKSPETRAFIRALRTDAASQRRQVNQNSLTAEKDFLYKQLIICGTYDYILDAVSNAVDYVETEEQDNESNRA